jgi:hypothetical protein
LPPPRVRRCYCTPPFHRNASSLPWRRHWDLQSSFEQLSQEGVVSRPNPAPARPERAYAYLIPFPASLAEEHLVSVPLQEELAWAMGRGRWRPDLSALVPVVVLAVGRSSF